MDKDGVYQPGPVTLWIRMVYKMISTWPCGLMDKAQGIAGSSPARVINVLYRYYLSVNSKKQHTTGAIMNSTICILLLYLSATGLNCVT